MTNDFGQNWPDPHSRGQSGGNDYSQQRPAADYGYSEPAGYGHERAHKSGSVLKVLAVTLPLLALAGGVGIGYALFDDGVDPDTVAALETERDELQRNLDDMEAKVEARDADIETMEQELDHARAELIEFEERTTSIAEREDAILTREVELEERESDLDARERDLESGEGSPDEGANVGGEPDPSGIINEGVWTVGLDIEPGTYRVTAEIDSDQFCYWAIYVTGTNQADIVKNGIPSGGRPQVTIEEGQDFESSGCGAWGKM